MEGYLLPDGKKFEIWEDRTKYKRTLHVARENPNASDEGDGSEERPFLTIQKAAEIASAGDMVLIHKGIYRETIRPYGSGESEYNMLCFKGAENEKVVVTGAEILKGPFLISEGWKKTHPLVRNNEFTDPKANVYMVKFPRGTFIDTNPFAMVNGGVYNWFAADLGPTVAKMFHAKEPQQKKTVVMKRGMLFCDGKRLTQVASYYELGENPGTFFVEDDGLNIHIRLPEDDSPDGHLIEFTAREQCFCPEEKYSSFIKIENITFSKAGNGFPPPQRGAVSVNCGHHFIINNCIIEDVNGIGIDVGFQCPARYSDTPRGYITVTNCTVSGCGIAGLSGVPGSSEVFYLNMQQPTIIVMNNQFYDNCWQDFEEIMESAAIKLHHMRNSLIIDNYINKTTYGCGIWIDASNENVAIRGNTILHTNNNYGSIFVEASHEDIELSFNIIVDSRYHSVVGGNGIYSHNCDNILNDKNIILGCESYGILHLYGDTHRINMGRGNTGYGVNFYGNVISGCKYAVMQPTDRGNADNNIYGYFFEDGYLKVGNPELHLDLKAWRRFYGWDENGFTANIDYSLESDDTVLKITIKTLKKHVEATLNLKQPLKIQINDLLRKTIE